MRRCLVILGALALISCSSDGPPSAAPGSSASASASAPLTTVLPLTTAAAPTTSSPLAPIAGCPDPGPLRAPDAARPHYTATAGVDVAGASVTGTLTVEFTPDIATDELVFRLWPNAPLQAAAGVVED